MPLLTLLTRCHPDRPKMLERCVASVAAQTDQDLQHLLLRPEIEPHDIIKVGPLIHYAASQITGDYVTQLPDDDLLASPSFVADLRAVVAGGAVEAVIHRMEYGDSWICPPEDKWRLRRVEVGYIAGQNLIARRDIYLAASGEWLRPIYEADFYYIRKALSIAKAVVWWNYIGIESQGRWGNSQGKPEAQIALKAKIGG
jgi:hypothetical protein